MSQLIGYSTEQSLPHGNGRHFTHLFLISTTLNLKKSEINNYLYHAPGNLLFYKIITAAW